MKRPNLSWCSAALALIVVSLPEVCNGQETNAPFIGEAQINGTNGPVKVQLMTFASHQPVDGESYTYYLIIRDPQTGFTWWVGIGTQSLQTDHPTTIGMWRSTWQDNFWIVPQVGILWQDNSCKIHACKMKSASLEEARRQLLALEATATGQEYYVWPLEKHNEVISVFDLFGTNFVGNRETANPPPPPKIRQLGFADGVLTIKLESEIEKTNRIGTIEMDSNFKVLKVTRSDK